MHDPSGHCDLATSLYELPMTNSSKQKKARSPFRGAGLCGPLLRLDHYALSPPGKEKVVAKPKTDSSNHNDVGHDACDSADCQAHRIRSEERRVGKECMFG